ncbi:MAG: radical SAM protein [Ruminococcaceae bacterium]|nr:radical SAM protein [Oscillospiraceae bacterium]
MFRKVYVEITNICNMRCSFCHGHSRPPRQMTREEFSLALDRLGTRTEYIYYHLMGEPLTHPLLPEFIRLAGERGYKSVVTTNGALLPRQGGELLAAGVNKINISLHSFEERIDEKAAQSIVSLAEFAKTAAAEGVTVVFRLWNRGFDGGNNVTAEAILRRHIPGEWAENTRGVRIRHKLHLEWGERFSWPNSNARAQGDSFFCYGLRDHFGILSDGTVVPCCLDSDGVIALGNIFTEELDEILNSERARKMVEEFNCRRASEELCKRCGYARRFV